MKGDRVTLQSEQVSLLRTKLLDYGCTADEVDDLIATAFVRDLGSGHYELAVRLPPRPSEITIHIVAAPRP
jgi:hypothetical protein